MSAPVSDLSNGRLVPEHSPGGAPAGLPLPPALPPLNVSGLVVRKTDLVAAVRIYVPQLGDITALDGERFLLTLGGDDSERVRSEAS